MSKKKVFVTVGTTKFDALIKTVLSSQILRALSARGYNRLTLQIGNTSLEPDCTARYGFDSITFFHIRPSLKEHLTSADLIISHAGAGSILEALEAHKHLIVVTNRLLQDNHQLELAEQLQRDQHLYYCNCEELQNVITNMDLSKLILFAGDKSKKIANFIDDSLGFKT